MILHQTRPPAPFVRGVGSSFVDAPVTASSRISADVCKRRNTTISGLIGLLSQEVADYPAVPPETARDAESKP